MMEPTTPCASACVLNIPVTSFPALITLLLVYVPSLSDRAHRMDAGASPGLVGPPCAGP